VLTLCFGFAACSDVTAIFYDEPGHNLFTGNRKGKVYCWGMGKVGLIS
jgi:hypothetical protein